MSVQYVIEAGVNVGNDIECAAEIGPFKSWLEARRVMVSLVGKTMRDATNHEMGSSYDVDESPENMARTLAGFTIASFDEDGTIDQIEFDARGRASNLNAWRW